MTCMITHQTLAGHLIPCLKTLIPDISYHVFVVHSTNLHDYAPNPSWMYLIPCLDPSWSMPQ